MTEQEKDVQHMLCGGVAGSLARYMSWPFDVIRKRIQIVGAPHQLPACRCKSAIVAILSGCLHNRIRVEFDTYYNFLRRIIATEGVWGLWKGRPMAWFITGPSSALTFTCYEKCSRWLHFADEKRIQTQQYANDTLGQREVCLEFGIATASDMSSLLVLGPHWRVQSGRAWGDSL